MKMEKHWHSYWRNPGDSGMATSIDWKLPKGWKAGPILWPTPHIITVDGIVGFGYEKEVLLATRITPGPTVGKATIGAEVKWLICDQSCIPASAKVTLSVPQASQPKPNHPWDFRLKEVTDNQPVPISEGIKAMKQGDEVSLSVPFADLRKKFAVLRFFPYDPSVIEHSAQQKFQEKDGILELRLRVSEYARNPKRLRGVLVCYGDQAQSADSARSFEIDIPIQTGS